MERNPRFKEPSDQAPKAVSLDYTPASHRLGFARAVFFRPAEVGRRVLGQVAREV